METMHKRRSLDSLGRGQKVDQSSLKHGYLEHYEKLFNSTAPERIVLLCGNKARGHRLAHVITDYLPAVSILALAYGIADTTCADCDSRIILSGFDDNDSAVQEILSFGQPDILIEDSPNRRSQKREAFRTFFGLVRDGGWYVVEDLHAAGIPALIDDTGMDVFEFVSSLIAFRFSGNRSKMNAKDVHLASAIGEVTVKSKLLLIQKTMRTRGKLRHSQVDSVVHKRDSEAISLLASYPARELENEAFISYFGPHKGYARPIINAPEIKVREYRRPLIGRGQQAYLQDLVLPDSYRLGGTEHNLKSSRIQEFSTYATKWQGPEEPVTTLRGVYYYLDIEYRWHFGHFLTEIIPRLYWWRQAKALYPDIKILISSAKPGVSLLPYQRRVLAGLGISEADCVFFSGEWVIPEVLVSAMPMMVNGAYWRPELAPTFEEISQNLAGGCESPPPFEENICGPRTRALEAV